jgi:hypothetical protein
MTTYKKVESQIKIIGGYYSRFVRAFVFETKPSIEKLNEIFGDTSSISETASQAGVSKNKVALIKLGSQNYTSIDKRTLRNEYNDRKLLVTKYRYFNGMNDSTEYIPESEWDWSDRDNGFEREFQYSSKPYLSGDYIVMGDYKAKYKSDIVQPITVTSNLPKSYNFYVDIDHDNVPNKDNPYELNRIDSDKLDIADGTRVVMSLYGNKYCGKVVKKEIRQYEIRSWGQSQGEIRSSVYYDVLLDNGVKQTMATFKVDTDNECDELAVPAILQDSKYLLPENFWSSKIIDYIKKINSLKRQKAARKKAEYARQDQQWISTNEFVFNNNAALWLGWEMENMEYARHITGESEEQQSYRMGKWQTELMIKPISTVEPKPVEEVKKEKISEQKQTFEAGEEANYYDDLFNKTHKVKILYKTGDGENGTERYHIQFENGQEANIWSDKLQSLPTEEVKAKVVGSGEVVSGMQHTKDELKEIAKEEGIDNAIASFKKDLDVKENGLAELTKYEKRKLPSQKTKTKEIQHLEKRIGEVKKDTENLEVIKSEQSLPTPEAKSNLEQVSNDEKQEYEIIKKRDGRTFYRLNNGDIEIVELKDGTAYVSIKGDKIPDMGGIGYTREVQIHDFNNINDAKEFALAEYKNSQVQMPNESVKPIHRKLRKLISILNNQ